MLNYITDRVITFRKVLITVVATFLGGIVLLFFSSIPKKVGLYRWIAEKHIRFLIGFTPAFQNGIPWKYTFEELYQSSEVPPLAGQRAIVTGSNSGIGYQAALALARLGAEVTLACRNPTKCEAAAESIRMDVDVKKNCCNSGTISRIFVKTLDTSSLRSVQAFAQEYIEDRNEQDGGSLDILWMNAGTSFPNRNDFQYVPTTEEDGLEVVFATNYVGHHLLYRLLEPMLLKSSMARVIQTSSAASMLASGVPTDMKTLNDQVTPKDAYRRSKLAQIVWVKALIRRLQSLNIGHIYANAFHPGLVDSTMWDTHLAAANKSAPILFLKVINWIRHNAMWTTSEGALTGLFLAVAQDRIRQENIRGQYFHPQGQHVVFEPAENEELQDQLWRFSDELVRAYI